MTTWEILKWSLLSPFLLLLVGWVLNRLFSVPRVAFAVFFMAALYCFATGGIKASLLYGYLDTHGTSTDGKIVNVKRCNGYRGRGMPRGDTEYKAEVEFHTDNDAVLTTDIPCTPDYAIFEDSAKVIYAPVYPSVNKIVSLGKNPADISSLNWLLLCVLGVVSTLFCALARKVVLIKRRQIAAQRCTKESV